MIITQKKTVAGGKKVNWKEEIRGRERKKGGKKKDNRQKIWGSRGGEKTGRERKGAFQN